MTELEDDGFEEGDDFDDEARDLVGVWGFHPSRGWSSPYRTPPKPTPARNY